MQEDDIILEDSLCPVKLDLRLVRRLAEGKQTMGLVQ